MKSFSHSEKIAAPQATLYALITDIEQYPKLFSYCLAATVHNKQKCVDNHNKQYEVIDAELTLGVGPLKKTVSTRNHHYPINRVDVRLHNNKNTNKGAQKLDGFWQLQAIDSHNTLVECCFSFSFGKGLDMIFYRMIGSFVENATSSLLDHARKNMQK